MMMAITLRLAKIRNRTVANAFESLVKKHPQKAAFLFEEETWTYAEVMKTIITYNKLIVQ